MRRFVLGIAFGLMGLFVNVAAADGPMVRWDRVEGFVATDLASYTIGPWVVSPRWRSTGGGRVMLNLETGFISIRIAGVSWANHYGNAPIGSPTPLPGVQVKGTVACDSTTRYGDFSYVDTPLLAAMEGDLFFEGWLDLPAACRERPAELIFLVRQAGPGGQAETILLYGAGRTIQ